MSNPFIAIDFDTVPGQAMKALLEGRIEELRAKLEDVSLTERDTQAVRGALTELRTLLRPTPQHVPSLRYSGMSFNKRGGNAA
ncbi:MAG: hypothetical protein RLZZ403_17 [Pseudomonadota bacterium]